MATAIKYLRDRVDASAANSTEEIDDDGSSFDETGRQMSG